MKKFNDFSNNKKVKNTNQHLSDDITVLSKLEDGTYEKIKEPVNILQITGLVNEEEIEKIKENFTLDTSLRVRDVKVGDTLWLTALLERTSGQSINSQTMGVVQVRVVNVYTGLNKLNTLIKKNK
jgi:hypothetical protein